MFNNISSFFSSLFSSNTGNKENENNQNTQKQEEQQSSIQGQTKAYYRELDSKQESKEQLSTQSENIEPLVNENSSTKQEADSKEQAPTPPPRRRGNVRAEFSEKAANNIFKTVGKLFSDAGDFLTGSANDIKDSSKRITEEMGKGDYGNNDVNKVTEDAAKLVATPVEMAAKIATGAVKNTGELVQKTGEIVDRTGDLVDSTTNLVQNSLNKKESNIVENDMSKNFEIAGNQFQKAGQSIGDLAQRRMSDLGDTIEQGINGAQKIGNQIIGNEQKGQKTLPQDAIKEAAEALKSTNIAGFKERESEQSPKAPPRSTPQKNTGIEMGG